MKTLKIKQEHLEKILDGTKPYEYRTTQSLIEKGIIKEVKYIQNGIEKTKYIIAKEVALKSIETEKEYEFRIIETTKIISNDIVYLLKKLYKDKPYKITKKNILGLKLQEIKMNIIKGK